MAKLPPRLHLNRYPHTTTEPHTLTIHPVTRQQREKCYTLGPRTNYITVVTGAHTMERTLHRPPRHTATQRQTQSRGVGNPYHELLLPTERHPSMLPPDIRHSTRRPPDRQHIQTPKLDQYIRPDHPQRRQGIRPIHAVPES